MINSIIFWVLPFVFILGTAVVLHEFGHFIVAKLLGVRVETFSVGFGPRLFGRRWGTTDYRLSLIPLGGYVKLGGDESNSPVEGAGESNIPDRERFDLRPRWQKFLVMVAGPVMNILTALSIAFVWALTNGVPVQINSPVVERVKDGGAAAVAGLRPGDRIVSFNGKEDPTLDRVQADASLSPACPPRRAATSPPTAALLSGRSLIRSSGAQTMAERASGSAPPPRSREATAIAIGMPSRRGTRNSSSQTEGRSLHCASSMARKSGPRSARFAISQ